MNTQYRRSIDELVTRYELEPTLRDIYVEGSRDYHLLSWLFARAGLRNTTVYMIEHTAEIPQSLLQGSPFGGHKARVVALSKELEAALPNANNVRGFVDRDFINILAQQQGFRILVVTDFACAEGYALSESSLEKFCALYLGKSIDSDLMNSLFDTVSEIFLVRAAKLMVAPTAPCFAGFDTSCRLSGTTVVFDRQEYLEKLLSKAAGAIDGSKLESKVEELRVNRPSDFRHSVHGHDAVAMLSWLAKELGAPNSIYAEVPLHRGLMSCIDFEEICAMPSIAMLLDWGGGTSEKTLR